MKKALSLLLCLVLCLSLIGTVFAEGPKYVTQETLNNAYLSVKLHVANGINFDKVKTLSYTFTAVPNESVPEGHPSFGPIEVTLGDITNNVASGSKNLGFLNTTYPHAGMYEYTVAQAAVTGLTEGEDYFNDTTRHPGFTLPTYRLKIQVANTEDGLKITSVTVRNEEDANSTDPATKKSLGDAEGFMFENYYEKIVENAEGVLKVTKALDGDFADTTKKFSISVVVTLPDGTTTDDVAVAEGVTWTASTLTASLDMKGGDTLKFTKLPAGTSFTVTEAEDVNYKYKFTGDVTAESGDNAFQAVSVAEGSTATTVDVTRSGNKVVDKEQYPAVTITNQRNRVPDEGIVVNNLPFVLIVVLAVSGMAVLFLSRRRENNI